MCERGRIQLGGQFFWDTSLPGLDSPPASQAPQLDETQTAPGSSGEDERISRSRDTILLERVRDRYYERVCALRRAITASNPAIAESISGLIRYSVQLGRFEAELLRVGGDETTEEDSLTPDQEDD